GLAFSLSDKYGDYGLISVVILKKEHDHLFIDTWLMSCRVLKRGMEQFVCNLMVVKANDARLKKIIGEYIPTAKNGLVKNLLADSTFKQQGDKWILETTDFVPIKNFIH
ncbi:MAG: FkbH domain-containing protein, partial [Bacteroidota bacterium]